MLKIVNPATEEIIRELTEDTPETLKKKFQKAKQSQPAWSQVPLSEKIAIIRKFREQLVAKKEGLAAQLTREMGKPISQARNELKGVLSRIDFFIENTERMMADEIMLDDPNTLQEKIGHEPLGVVANISAWNYPYYVGSNVFIPALLTGNAVLYKPSEFTALTGLSIEEMMISAGVPKGIFTTIVGTGAIGAELLKLPLNGIFFTGSFATGQKIAEAGSRKMIKTQLELGGKDPAYICDDVAIPDVAATVADGAFYNTGQSCCSIERIYVHEKIYDQFVDAFLSTVASFKLGDPLDEETYIGPLTRAVHLDFLEKQVADAQSKGAQLLCGGKKIKGKGYYFEPTVLVNVNHTMDVMKAESFGPIIGIQKVCNDEEALQLMNDTEYGLTAAVYSQDKNRAMQILSRVNAGTVYWNCCDRISPKLPWTGRGHSGIGSTLSTYGIQAFLQPKAWHLQTLS